MSIATEAVDELKTMLWPAPQPDEDVSLAPLPVTDFGRKPGWWVAELSELA